MARLSDSPHSPNQVSDATPSPPRPTTVNTGMWSTPEDERLREAVARHGTRWVSVAADVGTRNGEQCAKRWNDYVNPDLDHSPWSADEDRILLPLVALYGHNWKLMAQNFLQARAPLSIKNRYSLLMRRQKRQTTKQHHRSLATSTSTATPSATREIELDLPSTMRTPPEDHPLCNFDLIASSPFPAQDHPSAVSDLFSTNAIPGLQVGHGNDPRDNQYAVSARITDMNQPSGGNQQHQHHQQDQQGGGHWEGHGLCGGLDLRSLFGSADMSIEAGEAENAIGMLNPQGQPGLDLDLGDQEGDGSGKGVEFSVTCSRSKLKAMVCHVFEGAMSETAGLSEEAPVTVTLRLRR